MPAASLALSAQLSRRVEKLARAAGRTPESMLRFVIRDGLDYCEYAVKSINEGLADIEAGRTHSAQDVRGHFAKRRSAHRDKKSCLTTPHGRAGTSRPLKPTIWKKRVKR